MAGQSKLTVSTLPSALRDILSKVVALFRDGSDQNSHVAKYMDDIMEACELHGYVYEQIFHVKWMGIHPCNRDGEGVHCGRAQTRVEKIFRAGCSLKTLKQNLVGVEDNPATKRIEAFTLDQCSRSPEYAVYKKGEIKAGTVGASHCTHGFAQVHDERPCNIPCISDNGIMSKKKLFADKSIEQAVNNGLPYKIIRWEVEAEFPDVPKIVQAALNTVQQIGEGLIRFNK